MAELEQQLPTLVEELDGVKASRAFFAVFEAQTAVRQY